VAIEIGWREGLVYPAMVKGVAAGIVEGRLLVAGGMGYPWREVEFGFALPTGQRAEGKAPARVAGERIDAPLGNWSPLPPLPVGVAWTSGVAAGGGLVVVGGRRQSADGEVDGIAEVWFFDVAEGGGAWRRLADRPSRASIPTTAADGDHVYTAFGTSWRPHPEHAVDDLNIYRLDVRSGSGWETVTRFPGKPRWGAAMAVCGGTLYVIGGHDVPLGGVREKTGGNAYQERDGRTVLETFSEAWAFDLAGGGWSRLASPPRAFVAAGFTVADRWVVLAGGASWVVDGYGVSVLMQNHVASLEMVSFSREVWAFDTRSGRWSCLEPLPYGICSAAAAAEGNRVYLVGNETIDKARSNTFGTVFEGTIRLTGPDDGS